MFVVRNFVADVPVELRHQVVNDSLVGPAQGIGVKVIVAGGVGAGIAAVNGVKTAVTPNAKWTDAKLYPGLFFAPPID